jgi:hypothetical protein
MSTKREPGPRFSLSWGKLRVEAVGYPAGIIAAEFVAVILSRWFGLW